MFLSENMQLIIWMNGKERKLSKLSVSFLWKQVFGRELFPCPQVVCCFFSCWIILYSREHYWSNVNPLFFHWKFHYLWTIPSWGGLSYFIFSSAFCIWFITVHHTWEMSFIISCTQNTLSALTSILVWKVQLLSCTHMSLALFEPHICHH